jgi:hypothetical protein
MPDKVLNARQGSECYPEPREKRGRYTAPGGRVGKLEWPLKKQSSDVNFERKRKAGEVLATYAKQATAN